MIHDNPFGSQERENKFKQLLEHGLVKRVTIIEGNYPTNKEQRDFIQRIKDWIKDAPMR